jgi:hypothetical protein
VLPRFPHPARRGELIDGTVSVKALRDVDLQDLSGATGGARYGAAEAGHHRPRGDGDGAAADRIGLAGGAWRRPSS